MSNDCVQRAIDSMADSFGQYLSYALFKYKECIPGLLGSPIEEALLVGLISVDLTSPMFVFHGEKRTRPQPENPVIVTPQAQVGKYRLDFLLEVMVDGEIAGKIAIECDGFDFHDRTREQASRDKSRDRFLVGEGIRVLRFTGSEIYRDIAPCMNDVLAAIWAITPPKGGIPA